MQKKNVSALITGELKRTESLDIDIQNQLHCYSESSTSENLFWVLPRQGNTSYETFRSNASSAITSQY